MNKQKFKLICFIGNMKQSGNNFSINKFQLEDRTIDKLNSGIKARTRHQKSTKQEQKSKYFHLFVTFLRYEIGSYC